MPLTPSKLNKITLFKLPAAFFCGVRTSVLNGDRCETKVRFQWINQNPFRSMYFAVQAMAAELSTGALVMFHIKEQDANVSMLVASNRSEFKKKATGLIRFYCEDGSKVASGIEETLRTGEGVVVTLVSVGKNEKGEEVSRMEFDWTFKRRTSAAG